MKQSTRKPETDMAINAAGMLGEWKNVNADVDYISRLNIATPGDGRLSLQLFDARTARGELLGEFEARAFKAPQSPQAVGFYAECEVADMKTTIAANAKLGVLVLQSYTEFNDGSGRQNILTREFYRREQALELVDPDRESAPTDQVRAANRPGVFKANPRQEDFAFLRGRWVNTYAETSWATALTVSNETGWSMGMSFQGRGDRSEQIPVVPFVFDSNEVGFTTRSSSDDRVSAYAAYSNKGLIVMSGFHDLGASDHHQRIMSREFYYKHV